MTNKDDSAFASAALGDGRSIHEYGLTKREYFAAMVVQGMTVNGAEMWNSHARTIAKQAVEITDALIEVLNEEETKTNT